MGGSLYCPQGGLCKRGLAQDASFIVATAMTQKPLAQPHICKTHYGHVEFLEVPLKEKQV